MKRDQYKRDQYDIYEIHMKRDPQKRSACFLSCFSEHEDERRYASSVSVSVSASVSVCMCTFVCERERDGEGWSNSVSLIRLSGYNPRECVRACEREREREGVGIIHTSLFRYRPCCVYVCLV